LPRAKQKTPGKEKTLGEEASLPRANKKTLDKEKKHSARISLPRAKRLALGKEILKNQFFYLQFVSILNIHLYKTYAQIWHNFNFVCYI
jgi:hypothetical protein